MYQRHSPVRGEMCYYGDGIVSTGSGVCKNPFTVRFNLAPRVFTRWAVARLLFQIEILQLALHRSISMYGLYG